MWDWTFDGFLMVSFISHCSVSWYGIVSYGIIMRYWLTGEAYDGYVLAVLPAVKNEGTPLWYMKYDDDDDAEDLDAGEPHPPFRCYTSCLPVSRVFGRVYIDSS